MQVNKIALVDCHLDVFSEIGTSVTYTYRKIQNTLIALNILSWTYVVLGNVKENEIL